MKSEESEVVSTGDRKLFVAEEKVWCGKCSCLVRADGHEERCGVVLATPDWIKQLAWIGDAILLLQARSSVMACDGKRDGAAVTGCTSRDALSEFAMHYPPSAVLGDLSMVGSSKHSIADAVEAAVAIDQDYFQRLMTYFSLPVVARPGRYLEQMVEAVIIRLGLRTLAVRLPGYCYLVLCRNESWQTAMSTLGAYPTVSALRNCSYLRMAVNVQVLSAKCGYHLVEDYKQPLKLVPSVLEEMLQKACVGGDVQGCVLGIPELPVSTRDFSTCKCEVHVEFPLVDVDFGGCTIVDTSCDLDHTSEFGTEPYEQKIDNEAQAKASKLYERVVGVVWFQNWCHHFKCVLAWFDGQVRVVFERVVRLHVALKLLPSDSRWRLEFDDIWLLTVVCVWVWLVLSV